MTIRVLNVIDDLVIGGAEKVLLTVAGSLDPSRFKSDVVTLFPSDGLLSQFQGRGLFRGCLNLRKSNLPLCVLRLRRMIRDGRYDIVQLIRPVSRVVGCVAARHVPGVHVVARFDSMVSSELTRFRLLEPMVVDASHRVSAPSRAVIRDIEAITSAIAGKAIVIPNGCAPIPATIPAARGGDDPVTITTIGNYSWKKGYDDALQVMHRLRQSVPNLRYQIVGRIDHAVLLFERMAALGLEDTVAFPGEVAAPQRALANTDIYFQPSKTEGFGLAVLEAMAAGLPVVAANVGGIPELVQDGKTGLLVDPQDIEQMAATLLGLIQRPQQAAGLGAAARSAAARDYTATAMIKAHEQFFIGILRPNTACAPSPNPKRSIARGVIAGTG